MQKKLDEAEKVYNDALEMIPDDEKLLEGRKKVCTILDLKNMLSIIPEGAELWEKCESSDE